MFVVATVAQNSENLFGQYEKLSRAAKTRAAKENENIVVYRG
jgi:hypothetical protein